VNIKLLLQREHSKQLTLKIVDYVGDNRKRYKEIIQVVLGSDDVLAQRAAWVLGTIAESRPSLIIPYIDKLLTHFNNPIHNAIKRNTMRALTFVSIPKKNYGKIVDVCFEFLLNPKTPPAISIHAMIVLHEIIKEEEDLKREFKLVLEDFMKTGGAGVKSRGRRILKELDR